MLRSLCVCLAAGWLATVALGAEPVSSEDLRVVQGNWKPKVVRFDDADTMPADMMKQMTGVYDGGEFHLYFVDRGREGPRPLKLAIAKVAFDGSTSPKTMTYEFDRGPLKGLKLHGIYELTGDQLKLCYAPVEKPRPTNFTPAKGSGSFNEVWERKAK